MPAWWEPIEDENPEESQGDDSGSTAPAEPVILEGDKDAEPTVHKVRPPMAKSLPSLRSLVTAARFASALYRLSAEDEHAAVDLIYNFMDDQLSDGNPLVCDAVFFAINTDKLMPSSVVSFLIVTRRAASQGLLKYRDEFLSRSIQSLSKTLGAEEATEVLKKYR